MIKITKDILKKGSLNRPEYKNPKLFITIHNTGNTNKGANAKNHAKYLHNISKKQYLSWHYTVDDTEIYQHIPENETAYHAGDGAGKGNRQSVGIEICINSDGDIIKATNNAIELVTDICIRNKIPIKNIKQHFDWTGKNCPSQIRKGIPFNWNTFISKVNENINKITKNKTEELYRVKKINNNINTQIATFKNLKDAKLLTDKLNKQTEYCIYDIFGSKIYPK